MVQVGSTTNNFQTMKTILQCSLVSALAVFGSVGCISHQTATQHDKAVVRAIHGEVTYSINGDFKPVRPKMEFLEGTSIKTGEDSYADLQVNGRTSTVRVAPDTLVVLKRMEFRGARFSGQTTTVLDLKAGTILGSVKKISKDSSYRIETPKGACVIRGTDFQVVVTLLPDRTYRVTYRSVTGQLVATANVDGTSVTRVIESGGEWTPGEEHVVPSYRAGIEPTPTSQPPAPPPMIQPFNGNGAPNPGNHIPQ